jgi:hypothetical protein
MEMSHRSTTERPIMIKKGFLRRKMLQSFEFMFSSDVGLVLENRA